MSNAVQLSLICFVKTRLAWCIFLPEEFSTRWTRWFSRM